MLSVLLPTHNRPEDLTRTLERLGRLEVAAIDAEVIVVDNASTPPARPPSSLANGLPVRTIRLTTNELAAARNAGAAIASGEWLVMLDDDSALCDTGVVEAIADAPDDVAAIGAEIMLTTGQREAGGLPEVIIGCGAAIRADVFRDLGGYDASFGYYVEEYDLCARLLRDGWRVRHDGRFRVAHDKVAARRDMDEILRRLVRNNGWVIRRYYPLNIRDDAMHRMIDRYRRIAMRESALFGYERGLAELIETVDHQPARTMTRAVFDRFTGRAAARETLGRVIERSMVTSYAMVDRGKHDWVVGEVLKELGVEAVDAAAAAGVLVAGTLSPGPMLDAVERWSERGHRCVGAMHFCHTDRRATIASSG